MPRQTEKSRLLKLAQSDGILGMNMARNLKEFDSEMEAALDNLEVIQSRRYLADRNQVPKSKHWIDQILPSQDESRFKQQLRVTRDEFALILGYEKIIQGMKFYSVIENSEVY
jgi:hypothetical protein